jgi:hypothetical protein
MEQLTRLFESPVTIGVASFILAIYGPRLSPKLPDFIRRAFNNGVFRFIILILILMSGSGNFKMNFRVTMILAIIFVILMSVVMKQNVQEDFKTQIDEYYANYNLYAVREGFESKVDVDDFDELDELDNLDFSTSMTKNTRQTNKNKLKKKKKMVNINVKCDTNSMGNLTNEQHQQLLQQQEQQLQLQKQQNEQLTQLRQEFKLQSQKPSNEYPPQQQQQPPFESQSPQFGGYPQQQQPPQFGGHLQQQHPPQFGGYPQQQQPPPFEGQQQQFGGYPQQQHQQPQLGGVSDCHNGLFCDATQTCMSHESGAGMIGGCSPFQNAVICNDRRYSCPYGTKCWNSSCVHPDGSKTNAATNVDSFKMVNMERKYPHQLDTNIDDYSPTPIIEKKGRMVNPMSNFAKTEEEKRAVSNIITAAGDIFAGEKSNLTPKCKTLVKNATKSSLGKECLFEMNEKGQNNTLFKGGMESIGAEFMDVIMSELSPSANPGKTYTIRGISKDNLTHTATLTMQEGNNPLQTYGVSSEYMDKFNNANLNPTDKVMVQDDELITFKNNSPNSTGIKLTHGAVHALNVALNKPTEPSTISHTPPQLAANNNFANQSHLNGISKHIDASIQHSFTPTI